jgi:hypothetical protein
MQQMAGGGGGIAESPQVTPPPISAYLGHQHGWSQLVMPPFTPIVKKVLPGQIVPGQIGRTDQWPIVYDNRHEMLTEQALEPLGMPVTVGSKLTYKIKLPDSVYTSVWLVPLIDSRLWKGEPQKQFSNLPPEAQHKLVQANPKLKEGSTTD